MANQMIIEPDWENAPTGAEEFTRETEDSFATYYRKDRREFYIDPRHDGLPKMGWGASDGAPEGGVFIKRPSEDAGLSRHDAIQWCVNNLKEFTPLCVKGVGLPNGWEFACENGERILCHTFCDPIKKVDFEMARKPKIYAGDTPEQMRKGTTPWVPEVGEECEYVFSGESIIGSVMCFDGDAIWFKRRDGIYKTFVGSKHKFRPLKTKEEIEREEGIKALVKLLAQGVGDCEPDEYLATAVWDAGYRLTGK